MMGRQSFLDKMLGWRQCITVCFFFYFSLPKAAATHWLPFPNTRKESGMLFMSVPPHQGDEWVLLISWVCGWHLLFPLAASKLQLSFHWFQEECVWDTGRNNEAWEQSPQKIFGIRFWHVTWWLYLCPSDTCGGSLGLLRWIKVWRTSKAQNK